MSSRLFVLANLLSISIGPALPLYGMAPPAPQGTAEAVCTEILQFPDAGDIDRFLTLLGTSRAGVTRDLRSIRKNLDRYKAEGYGWHNILQSPGGLEPKPVGELLGAVRLACEAQPKGVISGTLTYRQRIALPPEARAVVTLEEVSRADAPATVISEQTIYAAGRNVPLPFRLIYNHDSIEGGHRYVVRAKIFQDDRLIWTSMTANSVMPLKNPTDLVITLERVRGSDDPR